MGPLLKVSSDNDWVVTAAFPGQNHLSHENVLNFNNEGKTVLVFYIIIKLEMCPWDTDAPAIAKFV